MDPLESKFEASALALDIAYVAEREFASFLDELAGMIEEQEMTYHEASWALRTAAGHLRTKPNLLGGAK